MTYSNKIEITGIGEVLFERSKKARHLNISVKPFAGVRVAVPDGLSFQKAEEFVCTKTEWIQRQLVRMKQHEDKAMSDYSTSDDIGRGAAKRKLTRRLKCLADEHGFTYNRVFIRIQKTRWGSCSQKNNISLNAKIVKLPEELMNYVILHELAHTRIKNHSNDFWELMNKLVGDGKEKAKALRDFGIGNL